MSESAYVLHLLRRVEKDVEFLQEQGALSYEDAALISAKLKEAEVLSLPTSSTAASASPTPLATNGSRVADLSRQMSAMSVGGGVKGARAVPPPPAPMVASPSPAAVLAPEEVGIGKAKAVWDYVKAQPDDLGFAKGEIITILEESNADWWKGQIGELLRWRSRYGGVELIRVPPCHQATASDYSPQTYANIKTNASLLSVG